MHVITDDKTAAIVEALAKGPNLVFHTDATKNMYGNASVPPKAFVKIKDFTDSFVVKVSELSLKATQMHWNLILLNEVKPESFPATLAADFSISSMDIPKMSGRGTINAALSVEDLLKTKDKKIQETNGILTRPLKNIAIQICPCSDKDLNQARSSYVTIADPSKLIVVPIKRTAFVRQANKVAIADGVILSNEISKPSSVEEFISIPINIAKAIVSILAQLVQFRVDNTTRSKELETAKLD